MVVLILTLGIPFGNRFPPSPSSAATVNIDNNQTVGKLIEAPTTTSKSTFNNHNKLIIHYKHEKRFQTLKRVLHQVRNDIFRDTPVIHTRLIVGNRNRRDAKMN